MLDDGGEATGRPASMSSAISPSSGKVSRFTFSTYTSRIPPQEPDRERVVVGDAVPLEDRLPGLDHGLRQLVDRALDAPAGHRPDRGAVRADQHGRPRRSRRGLEGRDDGADADGLAGPPPLQQLGQHVTHGRPPPSRSAYVASECPATKSSMYGKAASTPCCTGS